MASIFRKPVSRRPKETVEQQEQVALKVFRQRISSTQRSSMHPTACYSMMRAPGFDYINWKPYGTIRYSGYNEFNKQCHALAPYVHDVVVSACEGVEDRKWENMSHTADGEAMRQLQSRTASREQL